MTPVKNIYKILTPALLLAALSLFFTGAHAGSRLLSVKALPGQQQVTGSRIGSNGVAANPDAPALHFDAGAQPRVCHEGVPVRIHKNIYKRHRSRFQPEFLSSAFRIPIDYGTIAGSPVIRREKRFSSDVPTLSLRGPPCA